VNVVVFLDGLLFMHSALISTVSIDVGTNVSSRRTRMEPTLSSAVDAFSV
jgi:hypothetical protein